MSDGALRLTQQPDFDLGALLVSPATCRVRWMGQEIRVQAQTMAVLTTLARAKGGVVSRENLVEACWQGRVVSDDAITRAIAKVRALAAETGSVFVVETIPKIGYRLVVTQTGAPAPDAAATPLRQRSAYRWLSVALPAAAIATFLVIAGLTQLFATASPAKSAAAAPEAASLTRVHAAEVADAVLTLDEARLQQYLNEGWGPDWHLDSEDNAALHLLMQVCERNPTHDKAGVVRVAQRLVAAGANPALTNKWGDTPLVIAQTKRYCGPDHPVVAFLRSRTRQSP